MIDVDRVRVEIGDRLKWNVPRSVPPELLGMADGARTIFYLKLERARLSTIDVQFGTLSATPPSGAAPPIAYVSVPAADPTYPWTTGVDLNGAPFVQFTTPPLGGKLVSAYYKVSQFTDGEIQDFITRCSVRGDDARVLMAVHRDMIPAMLSDPARMEIRRIGDTTFDSSEYQRTQLALRKQFDAELSSAVDTSGPAARIGRSRSACRR